MYIQVSIIENTFSHVQRSVPKVDCKVLYICRELCCGYQIVSETQASALRSRSKGVICCPKCRYAMWRVIK